MKRMVLSAVTLTIAVLALAPLATADVPQMINYQGRLTDSTGAPLDTAVSIVFTIYDDSTLGTSKWSETLLSVTVTDGLFNVILGGVNPISDTVFNDTARYLGIQVGADPEISPRTLLAAAPYSYRVSTVDKATGGQITGDLAVSGKVGIGVDNPEVNLHVEQATDIGDGTLVSARLGGQFDHWTYFGDNNSGRIRGGGEGYLYISSNPDGLGDKNLYFDASGSSIIMENCNVGIGSNTPDHKLTVVGGMAIQGNEALTQNPDHMQFGANYGSPNAGRICFGDGTGWKLRISRAMPLTDLFTFTDLGDLQMSHGSIRNTYTHLDDTTANVYVRNATGMWVGWAQGTIGIESTAGSHGAESKMGVFGGAAGDAGNKYGVYGSTGGSGNNYAVYGSTYWSGWAGYAGYFDRDAHVVGTLSKGGGSFKIDHPLDPENKYLQHSFIESPDMMNVYNGNVVLDANGEATVELPDYFEALNRDFRYQLTCIGGFAPVYVAEEISGNSFKIAGGQPGMKVSWQVTGIRQDKFAEANRIQVEVDKPANELGKYMHPEAFGLGAERGIHWEEHQYLERRLQSEEAQ